MCMALFIFNVEGTKSWMSRLIVLVAIYCLIRFRGEFYKKLDYKPFKFFLFTSIPILIYLSLLHVIYDESVSFPRTLLSSLIYLSFLPVKEMRLNRILEIISLGGIVTGGVAIYEVFILAEGRAGNIAVNAIPYATYCAVLLLTCVSGILFLKHDNKFRLVIFCLGALGSCIGLILSQTRGLWIASFIPLILLLSFYVKINLKLLSIRSLLLFIICISSLGLFFKDTFYQRYDKTVDEVNLILFSGQEMVDSSIGVRLQLWRVGLSHSVDNLVFGVGSIKDKELTKRDYKEGKITKTAYHYYRAHYHNQYIDILVKYGVVGFFFFSLYIIAPIFSSYKIKNKKNFIYVFSITLVIIISGGADVPFHHTHVVYLHSLLVGGLILSTYNYRKDSK